MNAEENNNAAPKDRWKTAKIIGWGVLTVGVSVAATLAATRSSAQRENFIAYLRGQVDGLRQGGFLDGWTAAEEWYAVNGFEHLPAISQAGVA